MPVTRRAVVGLAAGAAMAVLAWRWCPVTTGFVTASYTDDRGDDWAYSVFAPRVPPPPGGYPVILYLHGAGERGTDGQAPLRGGLAAAVAAREAEFPFVVVFPQAASDWGPTGEDARHALLILDEVCRRYPTDPGRVCLTGFSMGGFGAWGLAAAEPGRWSCVVPVAEGGDPATAPSLKGVPCRCYHGAMDEVIPAGGSRAMVAAVRAAGGAVEYTEFPDAGHGIEARVYGDEGLLSWMLSQRNPAVKANK